MPARSWRTWHLLAIFVVGTVVAWLGDQLKTWAGERLKKAWFPGEDDGDDDAT